MRPRLLVCGLALLMTLLPGTAGAHEEHHVGKLRLSIGWLQEPAFAGASNAVQVTITRGGTPVREADLAVVVSFGDASSTTRTEPLQLEPVLEEPGEFRAFVIPTRPGTYTFALSGRAGGERIDETVTSGDRTFDDVRTAADAQFPEQDPTEGELAERLERIDARIAALQSDVASAGDDRQSPILPWAALGVAAVALVVSLARRREKGAS